MMKAYQIQMMETATYTEPYSGEYSEYVTNQFMFHINEDYGTYAVSLYLTK